MKSRKKGKIAVLMGGSSSEREISLKSGSAVLAALQSGGYDARAVDISNSLDQLRPGVFERAFIALHGKTGEDGSIQGLLEVMKIPYTGSGVLASATTMDKAFSKMIMDSRGIPTAPFQVFSAPLDLHGEIQTGMEYPVIVKPVAEGSTIGIVKVEKVEGLKPAMKEAFSYGPKILVEKFIEGREVTVSVMDSEIYPIVEVVPKKGFYDFESKYTKGMTEYKVPAELDDRVAKKINHIARQVYELFECRGAARVDIIISEEGTPYVLEINTIPGMTQTSLLPMAAGEAGLSFVALVEKMIEGAALDDKTVADDVSNLEVKDECSF
ncbi:MAG: D-alanine--D-alanine ligase [Deltaproteobacteria bacterium]|nr:D-alanine--D-alanine ligase [Deltaproteobacteria bacterium]